MALASGLQYIDNLALRFSLHGLEDSFSGKPTFCFSWSEPFDLDTVAGKLASNPKRSRSFPTTFAKGNHGTIEKQLPEKREHRRPRTKAPFCNTNEGGATKTFQQDKSQQSSEKSVSYAYASTTEGCKGIEEESSDEELCDLMAEQENIHFTQDYTSLNRRDREPSELKIGDKKKESRKRFLEEIDTCASKNAKRPRPRLDFQKVLQSKTRQLEDSNASTNIGTYFSPIIDSEPED